MLDVSWGLLLPSPYKMWALVAEYPGYLLAAWADTFLVSAGASAAALVMAVVLAVASFRFLIFQKVLMPLVVVSQSFPLQAIAPLIVIAIGRGNATKILIAFIIAFFPLFAVILAALKTTPSNLEALCRITDASFATSIFRVHLPAAVPAIIAGTKIAFTLAVLGAVVAEFVAPTAGIGRLLLRAQSDYNVELIYVCIGMLAAQGLAIHCLLTEVESRIAFKWR